MLLPLKNLRLDVPKIPGVSEIQSVCTQYAADLIVNQIKLLRTVDYKVQVLSETGEAVISHQDRSHSQENFLLHISEDCSCLETYLNIEFIVASQYL